MKIDLLYQSKDRSIEDLIVKCIDIKTCEELKNILETINTNVIYFGLGICDQYKATFYELIGFEITKCCENCTHSLNNRAIANSEHCETCWDLRGNGFLSFEANDTIEILDLELIFKIK